MKHYFLVVFLLCNRNAINRLKLLNFYEIYLLRMISSFGLCDKLVCSPLNQNYMYLSLLECDVLSSMLGIVLKILAELFTDEVIVLLS